LALPGLTLYTSVTSARSTVLVTLVALRQTILQNADFTAPWNRAIVQVS
jgi:hypothetical protein